MATDLRATCQSVIARLAGERYAEFARIYMLWKELVGPLLAEKSHPIKLEGSVLYVGVANNAWMQELVLLKAKIMAQCNHKHHCNLTDIVFTLRTKL